MKKLLLITLLAAFTPAHGMVHKVLSSSFSNDTDFITEIEKQEQLTKDLTDLHEESSLLFSKRQRLLENLYPLLWQPTEEQKKLYTEQELSIIPLKCKKIVITQFLLVGNSKLQYERALTNPKISIQVKTTLEKGLQEIIKKIEQAEQELSDILANPTKYIEEEIASKTSYNAEINKEVDEMLKQQNLEK